MKARKDSEAQLNEALKKLAKMDELQDLVNDLGLELPGWIQKFTNQFGDIKSEEK